MSKNLKDQPKTKDLLLEAFEFYLSDNLNSLDSLTISKISILAKIHRVTFYHHFLSLSDFIKWYLHKDLIFQLNGNDVLTIEVSLRSIFDFINKKRPILQKILNSKFGLEAQAFIAEEAMTYQLTNFQRIDEQQSISQMERKVFARFYAQAIKQMILDYILDGVIQSLSVEEYLSYCVLLIKNYIEKIIADKTKTT
jgi:AcrR family transcriptional regulator